MLRRYRSASRIRPRLSAAQTQLVFFKRRRVEPRIAARENMRRSNCVTACCLLPAAASQTRMADKNQTYGGLLMRHRPHEEPV